MFSKVIIFLLFTYLYASYAYVIGDLLNSEVWTYTLKGEKKAQILQPPSTFPLFSINKAVNIVDINRFVSNYKDTRIQLSFDNGRFVTHQIPLFEDESYICDITLSFTIRSSYINSMRTTESYCHGQSNIESITLNYEWFYHIDHQTTDTSFTVYLSTLFLFMCLIVGLIVNKLLT